MNRIKNIRIYIGILYLTSGIFFFYIYKDEDALRLMGSGKFGLSKLLYQISYSVIGRVGTLIFNTILGLGLIFYPQIKNYLNRSTS